MTVFSAPRRGAARLCAPLVVLALSCTPSPPGLGGVPATSRAPNTPWVPPRRPA